MNRERITLGDQARLRHRGQNLSYALNQPAPLLREQDHVADAYIPQPGAVHNEFFAGINGGQHAPPACHKMHLPSFTQQLFGNRKGHAFKNTFVDVEQHAFPSNTVR